MDQARQKCNQFPLVKLKIYTKAPSLAWAFHPHYSHSSINTGPPFQQRSGVSILISRGRNYSWDVKMWLSAGLSPRRTLVYHSSIWPSPRMLCFAINPFAFMTGARTTKSWIQKYHSAPRKPSYVGSSVIPPWGSLEPKSTSYNQS